MSKNLPFITAESQELTRKLEILNLEFLDLYTRHRDMVDNKAAILTSLYLEKLGYLQLELLEKQTEASRLKMKIKLIQSFINRNEPPDLKAIELEINARLKKYYTQIQEQSEALDNAKKVLSSFISEEESQKLREIFRVLCKKLHPDLNPDQSEDEKDLFIKVKAAYDLHRLSDLQSILLYLDDSEKEKLNLIPFDVKKERIINLEKQIINLKSKIDQLQQSFPFNIENLIFDNDYIESKQGELRNLIRTSEEEIIKYSDIIKIIADE